MAITVADLIKKLEQLPQDNIVFNTDEGEIITKTKDGKSIITVSTDF